MAIPVLSDQDFGGEQRITSLPLAVAAGQPLTFEQLGGAAPIESINIVLPRTQHYEYVLSSPGTLNTQSALSWLGSTIENELWQLELVAVEAECQADQIVFYISCINYESGLMKINYQVQ